MMRHQQRPPDDDHQRGDGHADLQQPPDELLDRVVRESLWSAHTRPVNPLYNI